MKKIVLLLAALFVVLGSSAQYTVKIGERDFQLKLDRKNLTAEIIDYEHKIDDAEFSIYVDRRKLKNLTKGVLNIPSTVEVKGQTYTITSIGRAAFADYTNFTSVIIPETVVEIGEYAFYGTNLKSADIPTSVVRIGDRAFGKCRKLKSIIVKKGTAMGKDVYAESPKNIIIDEFDAPTATDRRRPARYNSLAQNANGDADEDFSVSDIDLGLPKAKDEASRTFAIIIANENYTRFDSVPFALNDGRSFKRYCEEVLGLPEGNIEYFENATQGAMTDVVDLVGKYSRLKRNEGKAQIIVYYAGHGVPGYLLPTDANPQNLATCFDLSKFYKDLGTLPVKQVCVFLDACFSGKNRNNKQMTQNVRGIKFTNHEEKPQDGNMIVFSAARSNQTAHSFNKQHHGLFSYYLMKKLQETGGDVTFGELSDYIFENVEADALIYLNSDQHPQTSPSLRQESTWRNLNLKHSLLSVEE